MSDVRQRKSWNSELETRVFAEHLMKTILPESLVKALRSGQVMPVVGWGFPDFASRPEIENAVGSPHPDHRVCEQWMQSCATHVQPLYHAIAQISAQCILSLTPDPIFRRVLESYEWDWVTLEQNQEQYPLGGRLHIPLGGTSHDPENILLSERDFLSVESERAILWKHARAFAGRLPLLVLGVEPSSAIIRWLLSELRPIPPFSAAGWILGDSVDTENKDAWEAVGFGFIEGNPATWLRDLVRAAPTRRSISQSTDGSLQQAVSPYKNLHYFERDESWCFFGRESEKQRLIDLVSAHRLTIVTGASGSGKTSLLNAGLLSWADRTEDQLGVYARVGDDPTSAVRNALVDNLKLTHRFVQGDRLLMEVLSRVHSKKRIIPLVVLDQGEELFTRTGDTLREQFLAAVRDCVSAPMLVARFVIALRDDYLPRLAEYRESFPTLMQNVFYLSELDYDAGIEAIRGPALNFHVEFDEDLADQILKEIGIQSFAPTQIQIVCTKLFDERVGNKITLDTYKRVGGAREILRDFLSGQIRSLGTDEDDARSVLKAMVTSKGTKDVLGIQEIASRAKIERARVENLLLKLRDSCRILRTVFVERELRFELAHEYLTSEIWTWMTDTDIRLREIQDLFGRELRSWRRFRQLRLGLDRLKIFEENPYAVEASADSLTLLLLSSVKYRRPTSPWLLQMQNMAAQMQDRVAASLFDYFKDRSRMQRIEAAEAISQLTPAPIVRALDSDSSTTKCAALEMVGGMEIQSALQKTIRLVQDSDPQVKSLACGALREIGGREAIEVLTQAAASEDTQTAVSAVQALGRTGNMSALHIMVPHLLSDSPDRKLAAQNAVFLSPPDNVLRVLTSRSTSKALRKELFQCIVHKQRWFRYSDIVDKYKELLTDEEVGLILKTFNLRLSFLTWAKGRAGIIGELAQEEIKKFDAIQDDARNIKLLLGNNYSAEQITDLFVSTKTETVWAAAEHLATDWVRLKSLSRRLLSSNDPRVSAATFYAVMQSGRDSILSPDVVLAGLENQDATTRYYACAVANSTGSIEIGERLRALTADDAEPRWYVSRLGGTVGEAAGEALTRLTPQSKVWRKPFQVTFGSNAKVSSN